MQNHRTEYALKKHARELRKEILKISYHGRVGHVGSALSVIDILTVLYQKVLRIDPQNPKSPQRDRFLLSKGHAGNALYVTLAHEGFFSEELLETYCQNGSNLTVHPGDLTLPGIEVATGSLGHGLSIGAGIAIAGKYDKAAFRVYVLISDAECDEGSTWESILLSAHLKLDNFIVIVDYNKMQALGRKQDILNLEPFAEKWHAFGWSVREVDGHNISELVSVFEDIPFERGNPSVIIAHTVLGKGVSFMENQLAWHYLTPTQEHFLRAVAELDNG